MPSPGRATTPFVARARAAKPNRARSTKYGKAGSREQPGSRPRRAEQIRLSAPRLDLAERLRASQRSLRSRVERREALFEMLRGVNMTLEPGEIADFILERAATWVPAPCWALVSSDAAGGLEILADRRLVSEMKPAVHEVAGWVMHLGEEFVSGDLRHDLRVSDPSGASVVALPLSCRGRHVGALLGFDRAPSSREPRLGAAVLRALRTLLEPAAVALDNALQLKRAEALSVTDDLTCLYNSRYLNQVLHRETKRAGRSARPLSLLFIDLDGFKGVNDSYGHLFGSRALVEAAVVIRGCARETDVVARYGGDEFAIVLPDTPGSGAQAVGERIRERLAAHVFLAGDGLNVRLTASIGIATLPDVAGSSEDLTAAADAAMYRVKNSGKNGIEVARPPADES